MSVAKLSTGSRFLEHPPYARTEAASRQSAPDLLLTKRDGAEALVRDERGRSTGVAEEDLQCPGPATERSLSEMCPQSLQASPPWLLEEEDILAATKPLRSDPDVMILEECSDI